MALSPSTCMWTQGIGAWGDKEMILWPLNWLSHVVAQLDLTISSCLPWHRGL